MHDRTQIVRRRVPGPGRLADRAGHPGRVDVVTWWSATWSNIQQHQHDDLHRGFGVATLPHPERAVNRVSPSRSTC